MGCSHRFLKLLGLGQDAAARLDVPSTMRLSRRFLNLILEGQDPAVKSLSRIDVERLQLFYPTTPPPPPAPTTTMGSILLPEPIMKFDAHNSFKVAGDPFNLACYPFGQRKVLSTDHAGRNFLYDASKRDVAVMPEFRKPMLHGCVSLFVPSGDGEDDPVEEESEDDHEEEGEVDAKDECEGGGAGSLYVMVRNLREVRRFDLAAGQPSMDFEVLFYGNSRATSHCKLLPLPPFVLEPIHSHEHPKIRSYAVVGGGSQICVSVDGRGTYTMDTASHTWDKVGDWTLPFHGKVEYVPELNLWFGLSRDAQHLAAADLSTMNAHSPPRLAAGLSWEEFQPPEEWAEQAAEIEQKDVQLVNLGSGRFCVARFFIRWRQSDDTAIYFAVLTGVEVVPRVLASGEVKLDMIPHKSMCHYRSTVDGAGIEQLF